MSNVRQLWKGKMSDIRKRVVPISGILMHGKILGILIRSTQAFSARLEHEFPSLEILATHVLGDNVRL